MSEFVHPYTYTGVSGDHSKPGGGSWELRQKYDAEKKAEREATGDFEADGTLRFGEEYLRAAEREGSKAAAVRAREIINHAGFLAAKEARFQDVEIIGWDD